MEKQIACKNLTKRPFVVILNEIVTANVFEFNSQGPSPLGQTSTPFFINGYIKIDVKTCLAPVN